MTNTVSSFRAKSITPDSTPIDTLPDDEEVAYSHGRYQSVATFLAHVGSARIMENGELNFTIRVPTEYKYDAMPVTDIRGVLFRVTVEQPSAERMDDTDIESDDDTDPLSRWLSAD